MLRQFVNGPAIVRGYEWRQRITATSAAPLFPSGCAVTAHVRAKRESEAVIATLSIANGGIVRVTDDTIDVVASPAQTGAMVGDTVILDFVRTDTDPDVHLGFALAVPVMQPVTRGLA